MIRLVASDIDGTLLRNGAKSIDPVLFEQIRRLGGAGYPILPGQRPAIQQPPAALCTGGR